MQSNVTEIDAAEGSALESTHDLYAVRQEKLNALREKGHNPFQALCRQTHTSAQAKALLNDAQPQAPEAGPSPQVEVAGRILAFRLMGKASFIKIQDRDGQLQAYFTQDQLGPENYEAFKKLDVGDILGMTGTLFQTKTGEITLRVHSWVLVAKALRPLPEKWHGLTDSEQIYRQRYLDLIVNPESRERFFKRSRLIQEIRRFLWAREFTEVEGPVLQNVVGGAAARPFVTHMNALNCDFYLRISLELYLKRMLIGGFDRVSRLGGISATKGSLVSITQSLP